MANAAYQPTIREAVGVFDDAESLQLAIDEILSSGFDRLDLSLLASQHAVEAKLGHAYEKVSELEDDPTVPRTFYVSTESIGDVQGGLIGGLMYVGAVSVGAAIVATGGTLVGALVAAAMAGGAGGLVGSALARFVGHHHADYLSRQLDRGGLLLWVRTRDAAHEARAQEILGKHSAHDVHLHDIPEPAKLAEALSAGEIELALLDPASVFDAPEEVLTRSGLTRDQRLVILRNWAQRAREDAEKTEQGALGVEPAMSVLIARALEGLQSEATEQTPDARGSP